MTGQLAGESGRPTLAAIAVQLQCQCKAARSVVQLGCWLLSLWQGARWAICRRFRRCVGLCCGRRGRADSQSCVVLCCVVLCCVVLCCVVLWCGVLCCGVVWCGMCAWQAPGLKTMKSFCLRANEIDGTSTDGAIVAYYCE